MWYSMRQGIVVSCVVMLLSLSIAGCAAPRTAGAVTPTLALTRCDGATAANTTSARADASQLHVYVSSMGGNAAAGKLYALSPDSGATLWCDQFTITPTSTCSTGVYCPPPIVAFVGSPLIAGDTLYVCVSGFSGYTFALNTSDGSLRWKRQTNCMITAMPFDDPATPALANGTLYSGSDALDPSNGAVRWRLPNGATPSVVVSGALYGYTQGAVYAWDAQNGKQLWSYPLPDTIGSAPRVVNGVVYVGDLGGDSPPVATPDQSDTLALDARTGNLLWRAPTGIASGSPLVVGGVVYVGGFGPAMFAVDASDGRIIWRDNTATARPSTPIMFDGVVYFVADGVYAVDAATGHVRWRQALNADQSTAFTGVALAHGALYLGRTDGSGASALYALNPSDGAILWTRAGFFNVSSPVTHG